MQKFDKFAVHGALTKLKSMIAMGKTASGSEVWFDKLPVYIANYNNTLHTTIKSKPIELFNAAAAPVNDRVAKTSIRAARTQLEGRAETLTSTENRLHPPISAGDFVRISITKIDASERAKEIKGFRKSSGINWTKEIYQVKSISPPNRMKREEYTLYTADGHHRVDGTYYRGDLQKIEPDFVELPRAPPRQRRTSSSGAQIPPTALSERSSSVRRPTRRPQRFE